MATAPVTGTTSSPDGGVYADVEKGSGWLLFAGIMIMMVGVLNVIYGIAAIDKANFFVANQNNLNVESLHGLERAFHFRFGEVIASHGVKGYGHHVESL